MCNNQFCWAGAKEVISQARVVLKSLITFSAIFDLLSVISNPWKKMKCQQKKVWTCFDITLGSLAKDMFWIFWPLGPNLTSCCRNKTPNARSILEAVQFPSKWCNKLNQKERLWQSKSRLEMFGSFKISTFRIKCNISVQNDQLIANNWPIVTPISGTFCLVGTQMVVMMSPQSRRYNLTS